MAWQGQGRVLSSDCPPVPPRANLPDAGGRGLGVKSFILSGVDDGIRTRGLQGHNQTVTRGRITAANLATERRSEMSRW
jgi:hypothetical protein